MMNQIKAEELEKCALCSEPFEAHESTVDKPSAWAMFKARLELEIDSSAPVCDDCEWSALVPIARGILHEKAAGAA